MAAAMKVKQEKQNIGISKAKSLSYKKRKECIKKKTMELSVLCDIKACVVILEPDGQIETWPENLDNVRDILNLYQDFNRKNNCNKDRAFEPSVKVETCPEIAKVDDDLGTKNGCKEGRVTDAVKQEAWDDSWLVGESIQEILKEIDMKLEGLGKRIDFLKMVAERKKHNDNKGKEISVWDGEEAELEESFLIDIKDFIENVTSEYSTKTPSLEGVWLSEERIFSAEINLSGNQSIPRFEPTPKQNFLENQCVQIPQFYNLCNNSGMGFYQGTITQQSAQIPHQFNFQNTISTTDHGKFFLQEISASEQSNQIPDQCQGFDSRTYETRILDVMNKELYSQFQDKMFFSGGTSSMEPAMPTPSVVNGAQTMFGCMPDLCQQPMQDFSEVNNLTFSLIEEPSSSSLHLNMQY